MTIETTILIGTSIFCLIGWIVTHVLLQRAHDKTASLEMDIVGLEHYNHMLKNKLQKKKELLTIQDGIIKELKHNQPQED